MVLFFSTYGKSGFQDGATLMLKANFLVLVLVLRISSAIKFSSGKEIFKFQIINSINYFKWLE